jgi:hypothetical protein
MLPCFSGSLDISMSDLDEGVFEVEKIIKFRIKGVSLLSFMVCREKNNILSNGRTIPMKITLGKVKRTSM